MKKWGICSWCNQFVRMKKDGTVYRHGFKVIRSTSDWLGLPTGVTVRLIKEPCGGSGELPLTFEDK